MKTKFDDNTYCIFLNLADIDNDLMVSELDKMFISTYTAIVYDSESDLFSYYLLEKSFDVDYALCSISEYGEHSTYTIMENDKKTFIENVAALINS